MNVQDLQGGHPNWFADQNSHNPPSSHSFYNQNQVAGPMLSGGRQYGNQSTVLGQGSIGSGLYSQQQNFQPPNAMAARMTQSEESGGGQGGAVLDGQLDNEEFDESTNDINREEPENDIEYIIMNLYSKMKNLEGKYLDLANYYKQELLKSSVSKPTQDQETNLRNGQGMNSQRRPTAAVPLNSGYPLSSPQRERLTEVDQSPGKDSPSKVQDAAQERQILQDLIDEKRKLEDDIQTMMAMRGSVNGLQQHQQSPPKSKQGFEFKTNIPTQEQLKFLKSQLSEVLDGVVENLDQSQKKELQYLSSKQNEMYQLATRFNLPAQVKNESLGLWYDAKTKATTIMQELKTMVQQKKKAVESNFISSKINSDRASDQSDYPADSLKHQLDLLLKQNEKGSQDGVSSRFLDDFKKELTTIKRKQDIHSKLVQKLKSQLKFKEGLLKDEHSKLNSILRDLKQNLNNFDDSKRLMSGDKNNQSLLLSPFERKIATYQKSAEMRKQNVERSGSRGRAGGMSNTGSGFYRINNDFNNPQILHNMVPQQQQSVEQDQDIRGLRHKVKNFEMSFDDFTNKLIMKNQDISELERQVDSHSQEELKGMAALDGLISHYSSSQGKAEAVRSKSRSRLQENHHITTSPAGSQGYQSKDQDRKFIELQRNNEQIYQELRKANEKYLNQRVENNKLKDENQILKNNLEEAQTQIRKLQNNSSDLNNNSRSGQRVTSKQRPSRYEAGQGSTMFGQNQQRQASSNSSQLQRENEELRKKVQDLEKECYSLTYYQQEMQRRGPGQMDPYTRQLNQDNADLKNRLDQLCLQVQKFMLAMKRLQRAVNNKDKDIQNLKAEFEKNKKVLENMVKEIKDREESKISFMDRPNNVSAYNNPTNSSIMAGLRDARFNQQEHNAVSNSMIGIQPLRNRSQAPKDQSANTLGSKQQPYSVTVRNDNPDLNQSSGNLPPKRGQIRPKGQQMTFSSNMTPVQVNQSSNYGAGDMNTPEPQSTIPMQLQLQFSQTDSVHLEQQEGGVNEGLRQIAEERDALRQRVEELGHELDKRAREQAEHSHRHEQINSSLQQTQEKANALERVLNEYKQAFIDIEQQNNDNQEISELKTSLLRQEQAILGNQYQDTNQNKLKIGCTSATVQTLLSGSVVDENLIEELRQILIDQIENHASDQEQAMVQLQDRLSEKERDLDQVKRLLMDKLKELESSFVELSQDMIDSEHVQLEASKRYQQKQSNQLQQSQTQQKSENAKQDKQRQLEKSIENIIGGAEDEANAELYDQIDQLTQLNEQVSEENGELRMIIKQLQKDLQQQDDLMLLRAQFEELQEINDKYEDHIHKLQSELTAAQKNSSSLKTLSDKQKGEIAELTKSKDAMAATYQQQLDQLEVQLAESNLQMREQQDQRIFYESEFKKNEKQYKQIKQEKTQLESQSEKLLQREKDLQQQVNLLKEEIEHLNSLRRGEISFESLMEDDKSLQQSSIQQANEEETLKIDDNPKEAAHHYLRLFKATNKEHRILTNNRDKLQIKFDEMKEKFDTLKSKSRQNVEEIMSMESKIFELQNINKRLEADIERTRGSFKVEEEEIRKKVEEVFKERLNFKDSEIEQMTIKVARVSQTNIELTQRINRVQENNNELAQENEQMRNQVQTLEMELEMTKVNNERDMEQIQQQKEDHLKDIDQQLGEIEREKRALEEKIAKKKKKITSIRQQQAQEQMMKEVIKQSMEQKISEMKQQVEQEKQVHSSVDTQRMQQLSQAEEQLNELKRQLVDQYKQEDQLNRQKLQEAEQKFEEERNRIEEEAQALLELKMQEMHQQLQQQREQALEEFRQKLQTQMEQNQNQMEQLEQKLREDVITEREKKNKETKLVFKLQTHMRKLLEQQLSLALKDNQKMKQLLETTNKEGIEQLNKIREQIISESSREIQLKDKQAKLIYKLQQHARKIILDELQQAQNQIQEAELLQAKGLQEIEELKLKLEMEARQRNNEGKLVFKLQQHAKYLLQQQLQATLQSQEELQAQNEALKEEHQQDRERLEQLKKQELKIVEEKLREKMIRDHTLRLKKVNKEKSLVQVLQAKARQVILQELQKERQLRIEYQQQAQDEIQALIDLKEEELATAQMKYEEEMRLLAQNLESESESKQQEVKTQLQSQMNSIQTEAENKIARQQSEIERLRKEQDDLVKSLSEEQDQQTQDLLSQKEREKEALVAEMKRQKEELESKYSNDIASQSKQHSMMISLQEKLRTDLELKIQEKAKDLELKEAQTKQQIQELKTLQEAEVKRLQDSNSKEKENLQNQAQQQTQALIQKLELQQKDIEVQIQKSNETAQAIEAKRIQDLENLKSELSQTIQQLTQQIEEQKDYIKDLEGESENQNTLIEQEKVKTKALSRNIENLKAQLELIKNDKQQEAEEFDDQLKQIQQESEAQEQQYQLRISQLEQNLEELSNQLSEKLLNHERELEAAKQAKHQLEQDLSAFNAQEIARVKQNLEHELNEAVTKKDKEKTMLESLSNKIREDLQHQLEEKERNYQQQLEAVQDLQSEIQEKEQIIESERENQIHTLGELNQTISQLQRELNELQSRNKELESQLQEFNEQKQKNDNELLKSLRDRVTDLTTQLSQVKKENQKLEHEATQLKSTLQEKQDEILNLGEDLEGFAKDLEEQRAIADLHRQKQDAHKKELDMQIKLKDSQIAQLQQDLHEEELKTSGKTQELSQESDRRQKEKKRAIELEAQIKSLQQTHEEEMDTLQKENSDLKIQIEKLQKQIKQAAAQRPDQSLDEIEMKLGEFDVQFDEIKKQQKALDKQSKLNRSIIGSANKDAEVLEIGDLNDELISFCKRVKYQDQAWYLFSEQKEYYWINQSKIPLDKLKMIDVQEIEDNQQKMEVKLQELKRQKDHISQLIQKSRRGKSALDQDTLDNESMQMLKDENQTLKNQLDESQLQNKALQQTTIQLRQQISELNDMFVGLADTDKKSLDSITKLVDYHKKNNELNQQLLQQIELINKLENENDSLKKQIQDQEPSFARGGGKSFAGLRPENFDINTSSIDQQLDEELENMEGKGFDKIQRLEMQIEENAKLRTELESEIKKLRTELNKTKEQIHQSSLSQQDQVKVQEAFESFKLSKDLFSQFIMHIPITAQEHESRLSVLYRVLEFTSEEANLLNIKRGALTQKNIQDSVKKGVLGGLFNKKK